MRSAYRGESSADTRYRNRSYGPPRPTEHDPLCRIRHRRPCHTSRPRIRWRANGSRRSTDIRHTLRGNARTGRESRPGTVHQPPPAGDSPFGDPNTACTERASGVDTGRRQRPYMRRCLFADRGKLRATGGSTSGRRKEPRRFWISPDPQYAAVRPACWSSRFLPRLKRVQHSSMGLFRRDMTR